SDLPAIGHGREAPATKRSGGSPLSRTDRTRGNPGLTKRGPFLSTRPRQILLHRHESKIHLQPGLGSKAYRSACIVESFMAGSYDDPLTGTDLRPDDEAI